MALCSLCSSLCAIAEPVKASQDAMRGSMILRMSSSIGKSVSGLYSERLICSIT